MRRWLALLATLLALPAAADIYKCRLANGKTEIANTPCPAGSGTVVARPDEAVSEASRQQAERDVERMRNYVDQREAAQRADEAAERQERASQRPTASPAVRTYGDPTACLRSLEQQVLEATQRSQLEAECRSLVKPPVDTPPALPVYIPMTGGRPHFQPRLPDVDRPPPKPAPPTAPTTILCPPASKNCGR